MKPTLGERLNDLHPQMLKADSEGDRKKIAALVERAIQLMALTKQEVAFRLKYSDAGTISRWCSATERPQFDKLFSLDGFDVAYVLAIAERNPRMEVTTEIRVKRIA